VKGAIGFGFPALATPLLALLIDVKAAVVVLIVPNIAMDGLQAMRRGGFLAGLKRFAALLAFGAVGTVVGTHLLVALPSRVVTLILGCFVVAFVLLNATRFSPKVPAGWERWIAGPVGFAAGILGGITNVPGTPLVLYFYALGLAKQEFVRAVAITFLIYKVVQLGAVVSYGLLSWSVAGLSVGLSAVALGGFALGLRVQDRLDQRTFDRAILGFLALLGLWLVWRSAF
jgi:uncharacterized membrane protein YfcA